jgi:fatty acid elongase 3
MAPLADFLLSWIPFRLPHYLTSYVVGQTPLSTTPVVVTTLAGYLAVIFGIQAFMTNRQPYKLTTLFQIHNVILSSGSALLLVLMLEEIWPQFWSLGPHNAFCSVEAWTPVSVTATRDFSSHQRVEDGILLYGQLHVQVHRTF